MPDTNRKRHQHQKHRRKMYVEKYVAIYVLSNINCITFWAVYHKVDYCRQYEEILEKSPKEIPIDIEYASLLVVQLT